MRGDAILISKLRSNYRLSNVLIRLAFVLTFTFSTWQASLAATVIYLGEPSLWMALMSSALLGVILMFLVPFVASTFLNVSRFYNVPRAEYGLLALLFFSLYYLACGALRLVNIFTPTFLTWGEVLFPFFVSLGCVIWFYSVTKKLYFNDVTAVYYFRNLAITYLVFALLMGVVA